ncbi:MAG: arginine--tRNA ligase [Dehalococcoidales bacterium]|nr:arginine--tRNA ligase [Dehalococcoidales bacterium]
MSILEVKRRIIGLLTDAIHQAQQDGKLPALDLPEVTLEHPQNTAHGDYAANIPLKLAKPARMNPLAIAKEIASRISSAPEIARIDVAPPGFINITVTNDWLTQQVESILRAEDKYGTIDFGKNRKVQIEFVSVNPTGPLHVGHGRGAILGSTLANVLNFAGYRCEKEYYINDAGAQMNAFYNSLYARYKQSLGQDAAMPENGYIGSYMIDMAKEIIAEKSDRFLKMPEPEAVKEIGQIGLTKMLASLKADLEMLDVTFDVWFSEKSLFTGGQYKHVITMLKEKGYLAERDDATWFVSTALGEDKDNVIVRGDGTPTYFASDIAYHYNKFVERGFDKVIDIWGADHQGHVSRMKAVLEALDIDPARLTVLISQMVTLRRGGELVKISKRTGEIITLQEVVNEVGPDACRFIFLSRSADAQMDFDLELAKKESSENPVYYVQYAHARIASIIRLAEEKKLDFSNGDIALLTTESELALIRGIIRLPEVIEIIAQTLEPHHLAYYAQELATVFHSFYKDCRVVTDDEALTKARLKLVQAAQITLAQTLRLMGMSVLDRM